jgi:hydrogenase maturation protease
VRIIGLGNWDRGDDAAGLLAARFARELGADAREFTGDPLSLVDELRTIDSVVLVDAVVTGLPAGRIHWWNGRDLPREAARMRSSTHAFSLGDALKLAEATGIRPSLVLVAGIEAASFELGAEPSAEIVGAAEELARSLAAGVD